MREGYKSGFGNFHETEALPGALPVGQNSPQKAPRGLYAEQISGSAFTRPRGMNLRSWLYRIRPSVVQGNYTPMALLNWKTPPVGLENVETPQAYRWLPRTGPDGDQDLVHGMVTYVGHGSPSANAGGAVHLYTANRSMDAYFTNADAEMMVLPQSGGLVCHTEFGVLTCQPGEIIVIPRGIKFRVKLDSESARGYICENFGLPFVLPDLGPIGANGLANPRDFLYPTAAFEDDTHQHQLITKYRGQFYTSTLNHSPLDAVAWHGNYAPYKYDLANFNTIGTVSYDHPDPSIFTVLTSPSGLSGIANMDFVIFPPRWMVGEHTFRPPYFHRNVMSEFMGLIRGQYDAKPEGFLPGGASLHNCMTPHGPDVDAFTKAVSDSLQPRKLENTLAFMFESFASWQVTPEALHSPFLDRNYTNAWQGLGSHFSPSN